MKHFRVILIAIICFSFEKEMNNNNTSEGSKKIRVIMESIHDPILTGGKFEVSPKISKDSFLNESYFDKRGILVTQHTFNSKANLTSTIRFKYDENQNNIERISYEFDGSLITKKANKFWISI
jgi:hypothetical protein